MKRHNLSGCIIKTQSGPLLYPILICDGEDIIAQISIPKSARVSSKFKSALASALKEATQPRLSDVLDRGA